MNENEMMTEVMNDSMEVVEGFSGKNVGFMLLGGVCTLGVIAGVKVLRKVYAKHADKFAKAVVKPKVIEIETVSDSDDDDD